MGNTDHVPSKIIIAGLLANHAPELIMTIFIVVVVVVTILSAHRATRRALNRHHAIRRARAQINRPPEFWRMVSRQCDRETQECHTDR